MRDKSKPLAGLTVVDFGLGLAGALAGRMWGDLGAAIERFEPASGDPFYGKYPAYATWQHGKSIRPVPSLGVAIEAIGKIPGSADLCLVGGEDFPGLEWRPEVVELTRLYPRMIVLEIAGGIAGTADSGMFAVEILAQAMSGLVFEQYPDRPAVYAFSAAQYGAALQGMVGVLAALCQRERTGVGQIVRTSLCEGVLTWLSHDWFALSRPDAVSDDRTPKGLHPLIFRCADGKYIHFVLGAAESRRNIFTVLAVENPVPSLDEDPRGLANIRNGVRNYYGDIDLLAAHVLRWNRNDLLKAFWSRGVPAEAVKRPGEAWGDEQTVHNDLVVTESDGVRRIGLPFRIRTSASVRRTDRAPGPAGGVTPLEGLRVVDFGTFTAGPHASMILQDLGAEVIKVEPISGDPMRVYFRKFTASSRGKRVIAVNMKTPEGQDIVRRLCSAADMVHHNFRPGVTDRLGIGIQALHELKPELIILENAAYGTTGPSALQAGFDMMFHAYGGHEIRCCGQGNEPENYRLPIVDLTSGVLGAIASLVAYYVRLRSGSGATIASSLLNSSLFLSSELIKGPDGEFVPLPELDGRQTGFHPTERIYPAKDGWIAVAVGEEAMSRRLLEALGLANAVSIGFRQWGDAEAALIAEATAAEDREALLARLRAADVWAAPCRRDAMDRTLADPVLLRRGTVVAADDPVVGATVQLGMLFSLSHSQASVRGGSPRPGEHTREILRALGHQDPEIERLYGQGVVA
jgi:crotonobetainyl-CoA:carnitine CoA-transferase CaiB-like acyl-CoA transferase